MKYLIVSILILFSVQSQYTPPSQCPKPYDECQNEYSSFSFTDPRAPACWSKSYGKWNCKPKQGNTCNNDDIDITSCRPIPPPVPKCPEKTDKCQNGELIWRVNDRSPPCWVKNGNSYNCNEKVNGTCSIGSVDITSCFPKPPPPPTPKCPEKTDKCTSPDNFTYPVGLLNTPPCWNKVDNAWKCSYIQGDGCNTGSVNIISCFPKPPPTPKCPEKTDKCTSPDNFTYPIGLLNTPPCWNKVDNVWKCSYVQGNGCNADSVDITSCFPKPPSPPTPKCPEKTDKCTSPDNFTYPIGLLNTPPCWNKVDNAWKCSYIQGDGCNADSVNILSCFPKPPPTPKCPSSYDSCKGTNNRYYLFTSYSTPRCWSLTNKSWSCRSPGYGKCNSNEVDINTCLKPY